MKNGIFNLNTTDYTQIGLARQSLQDLTGLVNLKIANTDYSDVPAGETWISSAWSGDMAAAPSYMPKGVNADVIGYWFPADGRGPVNNDTMAVLNGASNPVLAHLFLNYLLDLPNVLEQHLVERLHAAAHRGDAAGARQGADPAAVAHLDGGGAVRPSRPGCSSCSSRWTRTRCGSRPGSS